MKIKKREPRKLPYTPKKLPKELMDSIKKRGKALTQGSKTLPDLDKIIKQQESGGYSKTYRK